MKEEKLKINLQQVNYLIREYTKRVYSIKSLIIEPIYEYYDYKIDSEKYLIGF